MEKEDVRMQGETFEKRKGNHPHSMPKKKEKERIHTHRYPNQPKPERMFPSPAVD